MTEPRVTEAQLGWLAAVLDLKAHVLRKNNRDRATPQMVLMVESKDYGVIKQLSALTGSNPEPQAQRDVNDFRRRGCAEHCPEAHVHLDARWQMPLITRWTITGVAAGIVLHNVTPYMATDRGFTAMMHFTIDNAVLSGQGSGAARNAVRRLSALGWKLPRKIAAGMERVPA